MNRLHLNVFHPLLCLFLLLWAWLPIASNIPSSPRGDHYKQMASEYQKVTGHPPTFGALRSVNGFPFYYRIYDFDANGMQVLNYFSPLMFVFNVLLIIAGALAITFVFHRMGKFSLRTMLIGTALCGMILMAPYWLNPLITYFASQGWQTAAFIVMFIPARWDLTLFFLPMVIAVVILAFGYTKSDRRVSVLSPTA